MVALTLAVPGPVAGMALVVAYLQVPIIYDTPIVVVLALAGRNLPYAMLVLWPAIRGLPQAYLDEAVVLGYGPIGRAGRVMIPLTRTAALAAWGVAFVSGARGTPEQQPGCSPRYGSALGSGLAAFAHGCRKPPRRDRAC